MPGRSGAGLGAAGRWVVLAVFAAIAGVAVGGPAQAQFINNQCATVQGMCLVNPAPVGSQCGCFTPVGPIAGNVVPPGGGFGGGAPAPLSNVCGTARGLCQIFPSPVGSGCGCSGVPGTVIPSR